MKMSYENPSLWGMDFDGEREFDKGMKFIGFRERNPLNL